MKSHALFVLACRAAMLAFISVACTSPNAADDLSIRCGEPAPLLGERTAAAPGYMVVVREGLDGPATAGKLAEKYGFTPFGVSDLGFGADFPDSTLNALRCEDSVRYIEHLVAPAPPPASL